VAVGNEFQRTVRILKSPGQPQCFILMRLILMRWRSTALTCGSRWWRARSGGERGWQFRENPVAVDGSGSRATGDGCELAAAMSSADRHWVMTTAR